MNDYLVIAAMQKHGGSFVKALALAAFAADPDNLDRIKTAFPEMWERYRNLAKEENNQ